MKRLFLIAGLMTAFGLAVLAASAASANFAGTWSLDKAKSQGLNPRLQGADKVTWTITQDAATISIDTKVEGGQPPAGGGGGGGGRPPAGPTVYKLDGSEVTSDVTFGQMTGKQTLKATWNGDALELSRKTTSTGQDGTERTSTNTQKLSLSGDGKVLTAAVHSEGGRGGPTDSTLVFNKQ
ncbi:MAG TPA: hypothetical protein VII34_12910 [Pyrinomonadaceae bacterium]|jgi:hypothetical protein